MEITYSKETVASQIALEDYFPLIVDFHDVPDLVKHYQIVRGDTDMLEFEVDYETGKNLRMKLVLCNHFNFVDAKLRVPSATKGELSFSGSDFFKMGSAEQKTNIFQLDIYADGVELKLGNSPITYVQSGFVTYGLNDSNMIETIFVANMARNELEHMSNELVAER